MQPVEQVQALVVQARERIELKLQSEHRPRLAAARVRVVLDLAYGPDTFARDADLTERILRFAHHFQWTFVVPEARSWTEPARLLGSERFHQLRRVASLGGMRGGPNCHEAQLDLLGYTIHRFANRGGKLADRFGVDAVPDHALRIRYGVVGGEERYEFFARDGIPQTFADSLEMPFAEAPGARRVVARIANVVVNPDRRRSGGGDRRVEVRRICEECRVHRARGCRGRIPQVVHHRSESETLHRRGRWRSVTERAHDVDVDFQTRQAELRHEAAKGGRALLHLVGREECRFGVEAVGEQQDTVGLGFLAEGENVFDALATRKRSIECADPIPAWHANVPRRWPCPQRATIWRGVFLVKRVEDNPFPSRAKRALFIASRQDRPLARGGRFGTFKGRSRTIRTPTPRV